MSIFNEQRPFITVADFKLLNSYNVQVDINSEKQCATFNINDRTYTVKLFKDKQPIKLDFSEAKWKAIARKTAVVLLKKNLLQEKTDLQKVVINNNGMTVNNQMLIKHFEKINTNEDYRDIVDYINQPELVDKAATNLPLKTAIAEPVEPVVEPIIEEDEEDNSEDDFQSIPRCYENIYSPWVKVRKNTYRHDSGLEIEEIDNEYDFPEKAPVVQPKKVLEQVSSRVIVPARLIPKASSRVYQDISSFIRYWNYQPNFIATPFQSQQEQRLILANPGEQQRVNPLKQNHTLVALTLPILTDNSRRIRSEIRTLFVENHPSLITIDSKPIAFYNAKNQRQIQHIHSTPLPILGNVQPSTNLPLHQPMTMNLAHSRVFTIPINLLTPIQIPSRLLTREPKKEQATPQQSEPTQPIVTRREVLSFTQVVVRAGFIIPENKPKSQFRKPLSPILNLLNNHDNAKSKTTLPHSTPTYSRNSWNMPGLQQPKFQSPQRLRNTLITPALPITTPPTPLNTSSDSRSLSPQEVRVILSIQD